MALISSKKYMDIGPFGESQKQLTEFGVKLYLSQAMMDAIKMRKRLEKIYNYAVATDDEKTMVQALKELEAFDKTLSVSLVTALLDAPDDEVS